MSRMMISLCLLAAAGIATGCGASDPREYGSLSGMVTLQGKPAPAGTVMTMINPDTGAATSAQVRDDGTYTFPRAIVGSYNVGFVAQGSDAAPETDPDRLMDQIAAGQYKAPDSSAIIPEKFRSPDSSGQSVTVDKGENNMDFNL
ncbi:carboxypeptidase-like regulatory domain-containing protein [Rubinisphaera margarita]|uniref:carboxypeptidase-like regulatory domain-containing protein n=1 Tax=Rubinisphaera margarita TaxID=2909586 RepID=UPI001EE8B9B1|nr:carboxypeptidase-like regulatory domain-containing protein [Rubinisphaera margarita]MCG6157357.1 carboxypeptidase-like regulatory domain-containing protein [Rubinisphaera margarita]